MTAPHRSVREMLAAAGGCALPLAAAAVLHQLGGRLGPPPLGGVAALEAWAESLGPAGAVMALVRVGALAACWWMTALGVIGLTARLGRRATLVRVSDRLSPRWLRRALDLAAGLCVAGASLAVPAGATEGAPAGPAPTMRIVPADPAPTTPAPTMRLAPTTPAPTPAAAPTVRLAPATPAAPDEPYMHRVAPGEHFWSIARATLEAAWARPATEAEVGRYWRELVDRNRGRLVDPAETDLLLVGQELELPPAPPAG
ncbi:MAG: hypothetical protein ACKVWR_19265 [Acidimicrobiales bacterium]